MADALCVEACELLVLDRSDFTWLANQSPEVALQAMACLAERLRNAVAHVTAQHRNPVLGRVCAAILDLAEREAGEQAPEGEDLDLAISQQDIADRAGTTRESVSRALSRLERAGAVRRESRRIVMVNRQKLRQCRGF